MPTAWDWAERICRNGPVAVRASKQAAYQGLELGMREGLRIEAELHHMILQTEDVREGQRAFNEKREPVWKGR
ncbi:MAG: enoyl-CoA hydratase-related protein [Dehalococcoidia bacterium]